MKLFSFFLVMLSWLHLQAQTPETTLSAQPVLDERISSAYSISFFSLGGVLDMQFRQADPSIEFFDNYISLNYKINRDLRISARPAFAYSTEGLNAAGQEISNKFRARDFSLVAKYSHLFENSVPAALDISNSLRLYFPTSEASRDSGMLARLRYEIEGRYNLKKSSSFRYYAKPSYYFQRSTVAIDNSNPLRPSTKTTNTIDLEHGGEFTYSINKIFAAKPGFEIQEKWSHSNEEYNKPEFHATTMRTAFGIEIRPHRDMNFTVAIQDSRDLIVTNKTPETGYTLMTNITMF